MSRTPSLSLTTRRLQSLGVDTDNEYIRQYVEKIFKNSDSARSANDLVPNWLLQVRNDHMMDDHILLGALSQMDFPLGTVVVPPSTSVKFISAATQADKTLRENILSGLVDRISPLLRCSDTRTVLIPMAHERHWCLVVSSNDSSLPGFSSARIYWADSLGQQSPQGFGDMLSVVKFVLDAITGSTWQIMNSNYMTDVLHYKTQVDVNSCGYYVISTISHFALTVGGMTTFTYIEDKKYLEENDISFMDYAKKLTADLRRDAVLAFFKCVVATYETQARNVAPNRRLRVSDLDVIHLITLKIRFPLPRDTTDGGRNNLRFDSDISYILAFGEQVVSVEAFQAAFAVKGEYFQNHAKYEYRRGPFVKRVELKCFRRLANEDRAACKVKANLRLLRNTTPEAPETWVSVRQGCHNHGKVVPRANRRSTTT